MKKNLLILIGLVASVSAFAQGTIQFNNFVAGTCQALVYGPETGNSTTALQGATTAGIPSGTQVYTGALLSGTGFSASLYGGPTSVTDPNNLQVCTSSGSPLVLNFRTGGGAGRVNNPNGVVAAVPNVAGGSLANIQMRAWDNAGGTLTSFEAAKAAPAGVWGVSSMFQSAGQLGNGTTITEPTLFGLTSFNIHTVPEPSTVALGVMGISAFLIRRRK